MNITKRSLKTIIREEVEREFRCREIKKREEEDEPIEEASPHHDEKGHFTSAKNSKTYSFTKNANVRDELKARGKYRGKTKDGKPKVSAKFGQNSGDDQCGRLNFDGSDRNPTHSCQDYKKRYGGVNEDNLIEEDPLDGSDEAYLKALIQREMKLAIKDLQAQTKQRGCRPSIKDFIRFQALLAQAQNPEKK